MEPNDRIGAATTLTSKDRSAIAVIGIRVLPRTDFEQRLNSMFQPIGSRCFSETQGQAVVYGIWSSSQEDLIVVRCDQQLPIPFANTGKDESRYYEIHCHGGQVAIQCILDDLVKAGVAIESNDDWGRAVSSRWELESIQALAAAATMKSTRWLTTNASNQDRFLRRLQTSLRDAAKNWQPVSPNDHSEGSILRQIDRALRWSEFGVHLNRPRRIVFCGLPNAGKSSLVNAVVGFDRSIVDPMAGTTRDVVTQRTAIDGWQVEIFDTAGIRDTTGAIEAMGVSKARQVIESAHLKVAIVDASQPLNATCQELMDVVKPDMVVHNKSDLPRHADHQAFPALSVSAATGHNIDELIRQLGSMLVPQVPPPNQWFPVSHWQVDCLQQIKQHVRNEELVLAEGFLADPGFPTTQG